MVACPPPQFSIQSPYTPQVFSFLLLFAISPLFIFYPHCRMQQGDNYIEAATYIPYLKLPLTGNIFLSLFFLFLLLCVYTFV